MGVLTDSPYAIYGVVDNNFIRHALLFIESLKRSNPGHPPLILLYHTLLPEHVATIDQFENIIAKQIDLSQFSGCKLTSYVDGKVDAGNYYARLLLWNPDLDSYDKIFYVDMDTVVIAPLADVWKIEEFHIVRDAWASQNFVNDSDPALVAYLEKLGITGKVEPVNSGAFLLPRKWRTKEEFNLLLKIAADLNPQLRFAEQSALSAWVAARQMKPSHDYRYNFQFKHFPRTRGLGREFREAIVVHFAGMPDNLRLKYMAWLTRATDPLRRWLFLFHTFIFKNGIPAINLRYRRLKQKLVGARS